MSGTRHARLGEPVVYLESVDSTNRWLKEEGSHLPHGTLCYTTHQQEGRGRLGRSWSAPCGQALAMSLLLKEDLDDLRPLPLVCGLAVSDALAAATGSTFPLKWPNDILCTDRKICGILCESRMSDGRLLAVAGIGINLTQSAAWFAEADLPHAGSVAMLTGQTLDAGQLAGAIARRLDTLWAQCRAEGFAALAATYAARCRTIGREVRVCRPEDGALLCQGQAVGIAEDGALLIETADGRQAISAGEASVRGLYGYT